MAVAGNRTRFLANGRAQLRRGAWCGLLAAMQLLPACSPGRRTTDTSIATPAHAATQGPAEPEAPPPPLTRDGADGEIDALLHDLRVQNERVDRELARKEQLSLARKEEAKAAADPDAAPAPAPKTGAATRPKKKAAPAAAARPADPGDESERASSSDWVGSPCDTACRAFASMERSARRICALSGEGEARCESARAMVKASRERIQASGCWCRSFGPR